MIVRRRQYVWERRRVGRGRAQWCELQLLLLVVGGVSGAPRTHIALG